MTKAEKIGVLLLLTVIRADKAVRKLGFVRRIGNLELLIGN